MKKLLLGVFGTVAVVAGFALIWNVVIPFIGTVIGSFTTVGAAAETAALPYIESAVSALIALF